MITDSENNLKTIMALVAENPNNYDLGSKIRAFCGNLIDDNESEVIKITKRIDYLKIELNHRNKINGYLLGTYMLELNRLEDKLKLIKND